MFDTTVTIVGNALNAPELRRTNGTNTLMASFRVASTSRRYDKDSGRWVDGPSLRVRVTCWRRLAEGVQRSVVTGDPLVVTGRMYTRDWVGDDGQHRVSYELEAIAVGHDLSRGFANFTRHRPSGATTVVEDAEDDVRIAGEVSVLVDRSPERPRGDVDELSGSGAPTPTFDPPPMRLSDSYDDYDPTGTGSEGAEAAEEDAMNVLRAAGLGGGPEAGAPEAATSDAATAQAATSDAATPDAATPDAATSDAATPDAAQSQREATGRRGRGRIPVPA